MLFIVADIIIIMIILNETVTCSQIISITFIHHTCWHTRTTKFSYIVKRVKKTINCAVKEQ